MDNELVKMCDVPEVQDSWQFTIGDMYLLFYVNDKRRRDVKFIESPSLFEVRNGRNGHKRHLYIPSIGDLFGRIGDSFRGLRSTPSGFVCFFYHTSSKSAFKSKWADTVIKALLKAYMHLSHNKTWDGKAWI